MNPLLRQSFEVHIHVACDVTSVLIAQFYLRYGVSCGLFDLYFPIEILHQFPTATSYMP